jgi:hypothetical protein
VGNETILPEISRAIQLLHNEKPVRPVQGNNKESFVLGKTPVHCGIYSLCPEKWQFN